MSEIDGSPELREGPGFRPWTGGRASEQGASRGGGVMLEGGAEDVADAWRWFLERASRRHPRAARDAR